VEVSILRRHRNSTHIKLIIIETARLMQLYSLWSTGRAFRGCIARHHASMKSSLDPHVDELSAFMLSLDSSNWRAP